MNRLYALAALVVCSCADTAGSIVVLHNQVAEEGCSVSADNNDVYRPESIFDVSDLPDGTLNPGFFLTPLVTSNFVDDGDGTKTVIMVRADVEMVASTSSPQDSEALIAALSAEGLHGFSPDTSGSLEPGGLLAMLFTAINRTQTRNLQDLVRAGEEVTITLEVTLHGELPSGSEITSPTWRYPVTLCNGCLVNMLPFPCDQIPMTFPISDGGECNPLQDGAIDCCMFNGATLCPAVIIETEEPTP